MMIIAIVLLLLAIAVGVVLLEIVENAPEGYEDAMGFHMGPEPPIVTPTLPPQSYCTIQLPTPTPTPTPSSMN